MKTLKFSRISIFPDTVAAFASIFNQNDRNCGILIAGTGSILYFLNNQGKIIRIGGWGRYLGDEGSGYWIGKEALNKLTKYYDGRGRKTILSKVIEKEYGIIRDNIIEKIYHNKFEISKITKLVFRCAEKGDSVSINIIKEAATNLAGYLTPLGNINSRIALCGSLFSKEKLLEKYLRRIIKLKYPGIKLIKSEKKPVWGAVKIAMGLSGDQ